jgi:hypothetical protein
VIFHFQFAGEKGWESLGAGEGGAEEPLGAALDDVRQLCGGDLPEGSYRFIGAGVSDSRWASFQLGDDGEVVK